MNKRIAICGRLSECEGYDNLSRQIARVRKLFSQVFGILFVGRYPLFINNSTAGGGDTPYILPVHRRYVEIMLGIEDFSDSGRVVYQFSHEMCHYMFLARYGISRGKAGFLEEAVCSACSLCALKTLQPDDFPRFLERIRTVDVDCYRFGYRVAERAGYDMREIKRMVFGFSRLMREDFPEPDERGMHK